MNIKLIAFLASVAILLLGGWYIHNSIFQSGYQKRDAELAASVTAANEHTRQKQSSLNRKSKEAEYEARKAQGADAPASPYLRGILKRMRKDD